MFAKKTNVKQTPLTKAALEQQVKRATYQGGHVWGQSASSSFANHAVGDGQRLQNGPKSVAAQQRMVQTGRPYLRHQKPAVS